MSGGVFLLDGSQNLDTRTVPPPARARAETTMPANTDWLYHHLTATGSAEQVEAFRTAAAGAGVIPWALEHRVSVRPACARACPPWRPIRRPEADPNRAGLAGAVARRRARPSARAAMAADPARAVPLRVERL